MSTEELLVAIARCPDVSKACQDDGHPCARVVQHQDCADGARRHVPEPWNGHLETAPILFVSSNPSYDAREHFPSAGDLDREIIDFFERRFDDWIVDGNRPVVRPGEGPKASVRYLSEIRRRAAEILPDPIPGVDYALTEVVHCKSPRRIGVAKAASHCAEAWLGRVLSASGAAVVVATGKDARRAVRDHLGLVEEVPHHVDGDGRHWLFIGGIGSAEVRKLSRLLDGRTLSGVRQAVEQARAERSG